MRSATFVLWRQERLQKHKNQSHTRISISQKSHGIFKVCSFPFPPTGLTPIKHKNLTRNLRLLKINVNIKHYYYSNKYKCCHYLSSPHFGVEGCPLLASRSILIKSGTFSGTHQWEDEKNICILHKNYPSLVAAPPPKEVRALCIIIKHGFLPNIIFSQTPSSMWSQFRLSIFDQDFFFFWGKKIILNICQG